jgi:hypothetical protein
MVEICESFHVRRRIPRSTSLIYMCEQRKKRTGLLSGKKVEIPEGRYKSDLELHDRYQAFSEQITRLALGGIAVIGFLVALLVKDAGKAGDVAVHSAWVRIFFPGSAIMFGVAAGLALTHKFFASDGLYHHFRAIKLLILKESNQFPDQNADFERVADRDEAFRNQKFERSGVFLAAAAACLVVAAFAAAIGFAAVLWLI